MLSTGVALKVIWPVLVFWTMSEWFWHNLSTVLSESLSPRSEPCSVCLQQPVTASSRQPAVPAAFPLCSQAFLLVHTRALASILCSKRLKSPGERPVSIAAIMALNKCQTSLSLQIRLQVLKSWRVWKKITFLKWSEIIIQSLLNMHGAAYQSLHVVFLLINMRLLGWLETDKPTDLLLKLLLLSLNFKMYLLLELGSDCIFFCCIFSYWSDMRFSLNGWSNYENLHRLSLRGSKLLYNKTFAKTYWVFKLSITSKA